MTLPPLKGLFAFEAAVRHGSVSRAAAELGVSQPAVSQQLRGLEKFFGRRLIERSGAGIAADPDVELFAARLRPVVSELRAACCAFEAQSVATARQLSVALLASLAQRWLIPRLIGFQQAYPEIDVRLMTTSEPADLVRANADLTILCDAETQSGRDSAFLMANRIFPVASPAFLKACPLRSPSDLHNAVLIRVEAAPRDRDWPAWLAAAGLEDLTPKSWQSYDNSTHALEAATAGLGVAMAHSPFVVDSLASGRLVQPFALAPSDADGDYRVTWRSQPETPRRIALFKGWLLESATPEG